MIIDCLVYMQTYEVIDTVDGAHINSIVYVNSNELWGGSSDSTIRIWDAEVDLTFILSLSHYQS
jgi:hypothetical protein